MATPKDRALLDVLEQLVRAIEASDPEDRRQAAEAARDKIAKFGALPEGPADRLTQGSPR